MLNVFFCQPFEIYKESIDERIKKEQSIVEEYLKNDVTDREIVFLDTNVEENSEKLWSDNLSTLKKSNIIIFHAKWKSSKRCRMIMLACKEFGYPYMILPSFYWQ